MYIHLIVAENDGRFYCVYPSTKHAGVILVILQVMFNVWPIGQVFYNKWIIDVCEKSALKNEKSTYLVCIWDAEFPTSISVQSFDTIFYALGFDFITAFKLWTGKNWSCMMNFSKLCSNQDRFLLAIMSNSKKQIRVRLLGGTL